MDYHDASIIIHLKSFLFYVFCNETDLYQE